MIDSIMMTRRGFLAGATAAATISGAAGCATAKKDGTGLDPNRVVIAADIHIPLPWSEQRYRTGREYPWIVETVRAHVAEILALDPLPANFVSLGDMSIAFGEEREYEILRDLLRPLSDRGVKVTLGMGNHDIRASFAKSFPECAAQSLVPGRYVHRVTTPHADFILLDSLKEPDRRGSYEAVTGFGLGDAQTAWLKAELARLAKPTFVCAHHNIDATGLRKQIIRTPNVAAYLHGHHHHWMLDSVFHGYGDGSRTLRSLGIGSFGIDRDVGYAVMDIAPDGAEMRIVAKDYYFPAKLPREQRPRLWDELVRDYDGRIVRIPFERA